MIQFTGEQVVPWGMPHEALGTFQDHIRRYTWALPWVAGREVVDLGCGTGYGAFMLSWVARSVVGVDVSRQALEFGCGRFRAGNLSLYVGDVEADPLPPAEVYVAFEMFEHLLNPAVLIGRIRGMLIWSVPVDCPGEFHRQVYSMEEACALVPGSAIWYQSFGGEMVLREKARFTPGYVCGVRNADCRTGTDQSRQLSTGEARPWASAQSALTIFR